MNGARPRTQLGGRAAAIGGQAAAIGGQAAAGGWAASRRTAGNPRCSGEKRERALGLPREREIEERWAGETGPPAATQNSTGPHSSDSTQRGRSQRSRSRPSLKLVVHVT
jgi:hypothetical protein